MRPSTVPAGPSAWPTVPSDATYASEILASARYSGSTLSDHVRKYLDVSMFQGNIFASGAGAFSDRAFGEHVDPELIVRRRTPFTFFASFLSADDESAWLSALIARDQEATRTFSPSASAGRLVASTPRVCRECLNYDQRHFGVGHWHVLHQVPGLTRCPWHKAVLHDQCGACGATLGGTRSNRLPGDPCRRCGSGETSRVPLHRDSRGYEALEALIVRATVGEAPELRPLVRMRLVDRIIFRRLGEHGIREAMLHFLASWQVDSAADLGPTLACKVSERLLLGLFRGIDAGCSRYLQAAVLAFALRHATTADLDACMMAASASDDHGDLFMDRRMDKADLLLMRDFCRRAAEVGYPIEGARALAAGASARKLSNEGLAAPNTTNRFLSSFPDAIRARYRDCLFRRNGRRTRLTPTTDREVIRERVASALRSGCRTRGQLLLADQAVYRWCLRYDSAWLDHVIPAPKKVEHRSWSKADPLEIRKILVATIKGGACTRTLLQKRRLRAYRWALEHDSDWLDSVIPARGVGRRKPSVDASSAT